MMALGLLSVLCGVVLGVAVWAGQGADAASGPCEASDVLVETSGFAYSPASVTVAPNQTVCWTNSDAAAHTATSGTGAFDSGALTQGQAFRHAFATEGTF